MLLSQKQQQNKQYFTHQDHFSANSRMTRFLVKQTIKLNGTLVIQWKRTNEIISKQIN